tara:strand:- start:28736 stop:28972 length:237 start_codon:yes stop_codon:yes gene_type:complete
MRKAFLFISIGMFTGLWVAWPGITFKENWLCVKEIIEKSNNEKTDIRTLLSVSPKFLLNKEKSGPLLKIRILGDTCFR